MSDNSTISTQYSSTKMTTYEPTIQPPKNNEQAVLTARPSVSGSANTPISSSLISALTRTAGTINQVAHPPKDTIDPVITNDDPDIVPPVISRRAPSTPPRVTPPPEYMPTPTPTPAPTPAPTLPSQPVQSNTKNVYGALVDISNAKSILGTSGYNYIQTDKSGFVMPSSFSSNDVILGGTGTVGGIGNINLNGAIRLAGANRDLTAQVINNYSSPKNVYGASIDLANTKSIFGSIGYNYIQTDSSSFVMPKSFNSNDIILGGTGTTGGIGNVNLNGAIRLAGANRDETYNAIKNYSVSKNVYGATIDLSNAKRILGSTGYNFIETDEPGFMMPKNFTSNDIILGGPGTSGGIGNVNLNGAVRLAGADRNETIKLIKNCAGTKNVYGAGVDLQNAKNILGFVGYNYIQTDSASFAMPASFASSDIILGGIGAVGGIGDINLNGASRLAGANRALTAQAINNYNSPKYVYGASVDLENAKNILGTTGYNYIQTDHPGFVMPNSFNSNDIILGGTGTVGGIGNVNLNGAIRLAGANRDETCNLIKNYATAKNVYGASVDLENAKSILGATGYNYIQTDQSGFVMPASFTCNDVILGGTGTTGGIGNVNLNGATRLAGTDRNDTIRLIKNYAGIPTEDPKPIEGDTIANESWGVVTGDNVNIRQGADINSPVLGQVYKGQQLKVSSKQGDWYQVYWGDHGGWIYSKYLSKTSTSAPTTPTSSSTFVDGAERYGIRTLLNGTQGDDVANLQTDLIKLGYLENDKNNIDGIFGSKTETAVRNFQSAHSLSNIDGKVGNETKAELVASMNSYYKSHPWDAPTGSGGTPSTGSLNYLDNEDKDDSRQGILDCVGDILTDIKNHPLDFAGGIAMGIDNSSFFGIPHSIVEWITGGHVDKDTAAYWAGKTLADSASAIGGLSTLLAGFAEEAVGGALDLTGIGALLGGIELNAAGAVSIAYGGTVAVNGSNNALNDATMMIAKARRTSSAKVIPKNDSWKPLNKTLNQYLKDNNYRMTDKSKSPFGDGTIRYILRDSNGNAIGVVHEGQPADFGGRLQTHIQFYSNYKMHWYVSD